MKYALLALAITSAAPAVAQTNGAKDWRGNVCPSGAIDSVSSWEGKPECVPVKSKTEKVDEEPLNEHDAMIERRGNDFFSRLRTGQPAANGEEAYRAANPSYAPNISKKAIECAVSGRNPQPNPECPN